MQVYAYVCNCKQFACANAFSPAVRCAAVHAYVAGAELPVNRQDDRPDGCLYSLQRMKGAPDYTLSA